MYNFSIPEDMLTKIEDIETDLKVSTEEEHIHVEDIQEEITRDYLMWGTTNGNPNQQCSPPPTFTYMKIDDNNYVVYLFELKEHSGVFYQFLTGLSSTDNVTINIVDVNTNDTLLIQSAIKNSAANISTRMYMCDVDPISSCIFFIWMLGNTLLPVPYGMIALCEPHSPFSYASSPKLAVKQNYMDIDAHIKQQWYDYAVNKKLLTLEEISLLNEGRAVFIKDINLRINRPTD